FSWDDPPLNILIIPQNSHFVWPTFWGDGHCAAHIPKWNGYVYSTKNTLYEFPSRVLRKHHSYKRSYSTPVAVIFCAGCVQKVIQKNQNEDLEPDNIIFAAKLRAMTARLRAITWWLTHSDGEISFRLY
ncbi:MAG: hypothetical protein JXB43_01000, partial [Dehalococcoidia bacterium]|nr:hypothetical protein [Dehalococcoidia bacterium]